METYAQSWLVGYTMPRSEKKLHQKLLRDGVETFLPLCKKTKQWSDRKKVIEEPLFPNYIFIKVSPIQRFKLLKWRELVRYICFDGKPTVVRDEEIDGIKRLLEKDINISREESLRRLPAGAQVIVKDGCFKGFKGVLVREESNEKVVIMVESIQQALTLHLNSQAIDEDIQIQPFPR
jgi:transcription antitermination factor NusG